MPLNEQFELLSDLEDDVIQLMAEHKERRKDWYFHEYVPWERGESFRDTPWDETQATVAPEVRTALVLNLLTEDNLPYYHEVIGRFMPDGSAFKAWNNLWTAEEGQHAIAIRSYLLTSRNCDPDELEDDRKQTMTNGYEPPSSSRTHRHRNSRRGSATGTPGSSPTMRWPSTSCARSPRTRTIISSSTGG